MQHIPPLSVSAFSIPRQRLSMQVSVRFPRCVGGRVLNLKFLPVQGPGPTNIGVLSVCCIHLHAFLDSFVQVSFIISILCDVLCQHHTKNKTYRASNSFLTLPPFPPLASSFLPLILSIAIPHGFGNRFHSVH